MVIKEVGYETGFIYNWVLETVAWRSSAKSLPWKTSQMSHENTSARVSVSITKEKVRGLLKWKKKDLKELTTERVQS